VNILLPLVSYYLIDPYLLFQYDFTVWLHDAITKVVLIVKLNILILVHVVEQTNVLLIIVNVKVTPHSDLTIVLLIKILEFYYNLHFYSCEIN